MIVSHDNPVYQLGFRVGGFVEATPKVWAGVVASWITVGAVIYPLCRVLAAPAGGAAGLVAAFLAVVIAGASSVWVGQVITRLDTPSTPFPAYYLALLRDERRAPEETGGTTTIILPVPPAGEATVHTVAEPVATTRSPHVCCPHPEPVEDPAVRAARVVARGARRIRDRGRR